MKISRRYILVVILAPLILIGLYFLAVTFFGKRYRCNIELAADLRERKQVHFIHPDMELTYLVLAFPAIRGGKEKIAPTLCEALSARGVLIHGDKPVFIIRIKDSSGQLVSELTALPHPWTSCNWLQRRGYDGYVVGENLEERLKIHQAYSLTVEMVTPLPVQTSLWLSGCCSYHEAKNLGLWGKD